MLQFRKILLNIIVTFLLFSTFTESIFLLYPASTVFQLISSVSIPITDLPPDRKVFFDWGFQMNYNMPFNLSSFYSVPIWATRQNRMNKRQVIHERDFTTVELYKGFENMLERYGYDRSCLKRSICELAQHPFDDTYENLITDLITFILTPSLNSGDSNDEQVGKSTYKWAEDQGIFGKDCQQLYPDCAVNLFSNVTIIYFNKT